MMLTYIDSKFASVKKAIMVHKIKIKWIFQPVNYNSKVVSMTGYVGH